MSYSPVARMDKDLQENIILRNISKKYGKTINQIILRWDIDTECIGKFDDNTWNEVYNKFNVQTGASETKGKYKNIINTLEEKVKYFNEWSYEKEGCQGW